MRGHGEGTPPASEGAEGRVARQNGAPQVDAGKYRESMERLFQIYSDISTKADDVMLSRCPYKDARARCTARFECRNQFFTKDPSEKPVCAGSDRLDYRSAWVDGGEAPQV